MNARIRDSDFALHGAAVVAADGVSKAPLSIRGGRIAPSAPRGARRLDLRDHLVFPGLVNAHDHLHVNCVPPLKGATHFPNSYEWIAAFQSHFDTLEVKAALRVPKSVRLKHGALKNLLAGTTFVVHHDPWHPALDEPRFPVSLLREFGWSYAVAGPSYGPDVRQSFADTPGDRPWMIHLAEGTDAVAAAELAQLDRMGCLRQNSVLIHGVGLRERDVARVIEAGAAVVWCPASNLTLLGHTLDPRRLYAAGRLALGTDSRLSGARDLLEELRGALYRHGLNAAQLLGLVTADAAHVLRLSSHGHLAAGAEADLVIVADRGGEESRNLIGLGRGELRAVVRGGVPQVADPDFTPWFDACGVETVQVVLDGRPKLLARALADPEVIALEPGLELVAARAEPARRVAMAG